MSPRLFVDLTVYFRVSRERRREFNSRCKTSHLIRLIYEWRVQRQEDER